MDVLLLQRLGLLFFFSFFFLHSDLKEFCLLSSQKGSFLCISSFREQAVPLALRCYTAGFAPQLHNTNELNQSLQWQSLFVWQCLNAMCPSQA